MPQNNQSITESLEFKDFCKENNLEVYNQESINVLLFKYAGSLMDAEKRIQQLEERLMEVSEYMNVATWDDGVVVGSEILADKWK